MSYQIITPSLLPPLSQGIERSLFEFHCTRFEAWTGIPCDITSAGDDAAEAEEGEEIEEDYVPGNTYKDLMDNFARPLERCIVKNALVTGVADTGSGVSVTTRDGREFRGDACIVTVPLGVLKARSITFSPDLPAAKYKSIDNIGMGLLNKVYLFFDGVPFWPTNVDLLGMALREGEYRHQCGIYISLFNTTGKCAMWAMLSGEFADSSEKLSDEDLVSRVMEPLRAVFPSCPERPAEYYRTRWRSDELARGSYSALQINSSIQDREVLREPCGRVHFSGEATNLEHPSCVNGAANAGIYTAHKVLEALEKNL